MRERTLAKLRLNVKPYAICWTEDTLSMRWRTGFSLKFSVAQIQRLQANIRRSEPVIMMLSLGIIGMMMVSLMEGLR